MINTDIDDDALSNGHKFYAKSRKRMNGSLSIAAINKKKKDKKDEKDEKDKFNVMENRLLDLEKENKVFQLENQDLKEQNQKLIRNLEYYQKLYITYKNLCKDREAEASSSDIAAQFIFIKAEQLIELQSNQQIESSAKVIELLKQQEEAKKLKFQIDLLERELERFDSDFSTKAKASCNPGQVLRNGFTASDKTTFWVSSGIAKGRMRNKFKDLDEKQRRARIQDTLLIILFNNDPRCDPASSESKNKAVPLLTQLVKSFGFEL